MLIPKKSCVFWLLFFLAICMPVIMGSCATVPIPISKDCPQYDVVIRSNDNDLIMMEKGYLNSEKEGDTWIKLEDFQHGLRNSNSY